MVKKSNDSESELVAFCPECHEYVEPEQIGDRCPNLECGRTLVKRRGYVCRAVLRDGWTCDHFFMSKQEYRNHDCHEVQP